jgi:hypothetical protein
MTNTIIPIIERPSTNGITKANSIFLRDWPRRIADPQDSEKHLVVRGTLPPRLQKRTYPCLEDLQRRLPSPPPNCRHVPIAGHIVLLNRRTNVVVDVFHFEAF